ncbi:MAG: energy transducer TonB, partial [Flavobacteriales bacterium]
CFQQQLLKFVGKNFQVSEAMMMFSNAEKVFVEFIIEKDGHVRQAKVVRGEDELISEEAIRMVKSLPEFTPAKINGKPVRMSYILPVNVKLQ